MALTREVLITSESSGQLWNSCVWDVNTCTHLATYKGGSSTPHTMCLLKDDYLLSAISNKPLIHVWSLQKREQIQQRIVCPGQITALASSPDGFFVIGAVQEKIHIWQVSTGNLMAVLQKHYQTVKCLKFTSDGSHFVSAGDDNLVLVWPVWKVLDQSSSSGSLGVDPRYTWSQHSLPVTDLHIGIGGIQSRVFSSSLDQTCKVWDMCTGQLVLNIIFDTGITSVVTDSTENKMYAGGINGQIYVVNLHQQPVKTEVHISIDETNPKEQMILKGHSKQVSCMCITLDGSSLISGSHDQNVCIWDIYSRQCVKTLPHKGAISNVIVTLTPPGILNTDYKAKHPLQMFKRYLYNSTQSIDQHGEDSGNMSVRLTGSPVNGETTDIDAVMNKYVAMLERMEQEDVEKDKVEDDKEKLETKVQKLRNVNKQIYEFAIQNIISEDT